MNPLKRMIRKIVILILNRTYFFLTKVKNQSPFSGATILVTLLISITLGNLQLLLYAFKSAALVRDIPTYLLIIIIIFGALFLYAKRNEEEIITKNIDSPAKKNVFVMLIYLISIIVTVVLSDINKDKISNLRRSEDTQPRKQSLENKIRKWLE